MNAVELVVIVILLLMIVPDLCSKIRRPALPLVIYLAVGMLLGPIMAPETMALLSGVREFGFILLLFGIGLEIDLPKKHHIVPAMRVAGRISIAQFLLSMLTALCSGLGWAESCIIGIGLSACSLGLIMPALRDQSTLEEQTLRQIVHVAMVVEIAAILLLAGSEVVLTRGFGWALAARFVGIAIVLLALLYSADRILGLLNPLIERISHWRGHILVLFILFSAALGERLGLSAAKTAFFLGLFITRSTCERMEIQKHLAPFSERLLIPLFVVSLGALIPPRAFLSHTGMIAIFAATLLMGSRLLLVGRAIPSLYRHRQALLFCPNLTIVAIVVYAFSSHLSASAVEWTLACSLIMSLVPLAIMPSATSQSQQTGAHTEPTSGSGI